MAFNYVVHMSTLKYFKRGSILPSSSRPLSNVVPCKGIKAANKEVNEVVNGMKLAVEYTQYSANTI